MHPVLRRVLLHGGLTAAVLALIGVAFAELAGIWLAGNTNRSGAAANEPVNAALRYRVPLMMALWGFLFVLVGELVIWRVRGNKPPAPTAPPPDDAEKLLNELLAQAEAAEAKRQSGVGSQESEDRSQKAEDGKQEPADGKQEAETKTDVPPA